MLLGVSHLWGMARVSGSDDYTGAEQDKLLVFNQGPLGCNKKKNSSNWLWLKETLLVYIDERLGINITYKKFKKFRLTVRAQMKC